MRAQSLGRRPANAWSWRIRPRSRTTSSAEYGPRIPSSAGRSPSVPELGGFGALLHPWFLPPSRVVTITVNDREKLWWKGNDPSGPREVVGAEQAGSGRRRALATYEVERPFDHVPMVADGGG